MKKCDICDLTYDDNQNFCNRCGNPLSMASIVVTNKQLNKGEKRCLKCNIAYEGDKKFCEKCGSPLSVVTQSVSKVDAKKFVFEEKLKDNQLDVKLLSEYAQFLYDSNDDKESTFILFRILAIDDTNNFANNLLFTCYFELDQYEDAVEIGEELLAKNAKDISLLKKLVTLAEKLNQREKACNYSNKIIEIEPNNIFGLTIKVIYLLTNNKIKEAIPICNKLVELGQNVPLYLIYIGIDYAFQGKFDIAIQNFEKAYNISIEKPNDIDIQKSNLSINLKGIHNNRSELYWTYCLCMINGNISEIEKKFNSIDFHSLEDNYFISDGDIAIKTVYLILSNKIKYITFDNRQIFNGLINRYYGLIAFYFTKFSKETIAECWYNVALMQDKIGLNKDALISCQYASTVIPTEKKYIEKIIEIQEFINTKNTKYKRNKIIIISSIVCLIIVGITSVLYYLKLKEDNKWSNVKTNNTIRYSLISLKDYLNEYPNGKYANEAKQDIDSLLWINALNSNKYESYKLYNDSSYYKSHSQEADSLEQLVLWHNAKVENTYEAYQRYVGLFPNGKYSDKANKIADKKLWQKTMKDGFVSSYKYYLQKFPLGKYVLKANNLLDDHAWHLAESQNKQSGFDDYKNSFPNGKYIAEANSMIEYFKSIEKENQTNSTNSNNVTSNNQSSSSRGYQRSNRDYFTCESAVHEFLSNHSFRSDDGSSLSYSIGDLTIIYSSGRLRFTNIEVKIQNQDLAVVSATDIGSGRTLRIQLNAAYGSIVDMNDNSTSFQAVN